MARDRNRSTSEDVRWSDLWCSLHRNWQGEPWVTNWACWQFVFAGPSPKDCQHWGQTGGSGDLQSASHDRGAAGPALRPARPRPEDPADVRGGQQESAGDFLLRAGLAAPAEVQAGRQLFRLPGPAGSLLRLGRGVFLLCFPHNIQLSLCFRVFTKCILRPPQTVRGQPVLGPHRGVQGETASPPPYQPHHRVVAGHQQWPLLCPASTSLAPLWREPGWPGPHHSYRAPPGGEVQVQHRGALHGRGHLLCQRSHPRLRGRLPPGQKVPVRIRQPVSRALPQQVTTPRTLAPNSSPQTKFS